MNTDTLDELLTTIWKLLDEAQSTPSSPFRTAVIATTTGNASGLRTVVLRDFNAQTPSLFCHTDRRSAKSLQIAARPHTEWLFHDPDRQLQIRLAGPAQVHTRGEQVRKLWQAVPLRARLGYLVETAPGSLSRKRTTGLPAGVLERYPSAQESEAGFDNFAVIECHIEFVDWLQLGTFGHTRAQFWRQHDSTWKSAWVVP